VNFAAPIADGDFEISRRAPRTNRTNQHWIVELSQDGAVKTTATAIFGIRRDTWSDTQAVPPAVPPPEQISRSSRENLPVWIGMYDMRFAEGSFSGGAVQTGSSSTTTLWVRDAAQRQVDFSALTAMSDIFFPRVYLRRGVIPAGTISMTTYFHADSQHLDALGGDYILATAHADRFDRGFFDQNAQLVTQSRDEIRALVERTGESVGLLVPINDAVVCLAMVESDQPLRCSFARGRAHPLTRGASAKALRACWCTERWTSCAATWRIAARKKAGHE